MPAQFRWVATTTVVLLLLLLCIFMVTSCSDDEDGRPLPPYVQTLCELVTDSVGRAAMVRFDDGHECAVKNHIDGLTPDSIYRIQATTLEDSEGVSLWNAQGVISPLPRLFQLNELKTDPLEVVTAWRTERYVNLRLRATSDSRTPHYLSFADSGVARHPDGRRTKVITLHHDGNGAEAHYTAELVTSCPVYHLTDQLRHGTDSVRLVVHTPKGKYTFTTIY